MNKYCRKCDISVINNFMPCRREGNKADILFIGEAPGHTENKTKVPFSGKAGTHLRMFIDRYGLKSLCSITNVIKCQPHMNRDPFPDEIDNCKPYLLQDIEEVSPKLIVLAGATATKVFIPDDRFYLGKYLNKPVKVKSTIIIPIYHPSYIMREGKDEEYIKSFNIISEIYNAMNPYYRKRTFKLQSNND